MTQEHKERLAREYANITITKYSHCENGMLWNIIYDTCIAMLDARDEEVDRLANNVIELNADYVRIMCERDSLRSESRIEIESLRNEIEKLKAELNKAQNPWRDAKTDPPKEWQEVFAHVPNLCGGEYCKLTYLDNYRWSQDEGDWTTEFTDSTVHWMPIPQVPEGGES